MVGLGEDRARSRPPSASRSCRGWRAKSCSRFLPAWSLIRLTAPPWPTGTDRRRSDGPLPRAGPPKPRSSSKPTPAHPARGRCGSAGASSVGRARDRRSRRRCPRRRRARRRQARGFDPADASELGDVVAGRELPSMVAFRLRPLAGSDARTLAIDVVRYTPQAVLIANVEEARYRALASKTGGNWSRRGTPCETTSAASSRSRCPPEQRCGARRRGPADSPRRRRHERPAAAAGKGTRGRGSSDVCRISSTCSASGVDGQGTDDTRAAGARPADLAHRYRVSLLPSLSRRATAWRIPPRRRPGPAGRGVPSTVAAGGKSRHWSSPRTRRRSGLQTLVDRFRNEGGGRTVIGSLPVT